MCPKGLGGSSPPSPTTLFQARGAVSLPVMTQWRIELKTEDVVALSRGEEVTVTAVDEEQDTSTESIDVTIALLDY